MKAAFSPLNLTLRNMLLAQVKGHVVSSAKIDSLTGKKLLLVEIVTVRDEGLERTERHMVCVDAVGAGERELVLVVMGSSARMAPHLGDVPTDAVIVGIIDSLQAFGRDMELADA
jgi:ethanolamine utilization protein EutN